MKKYSISALLSFVAIGSFIFLGNEKVTHTDIAIGAISMSLASSSALDTEPLPGTKLIVAPRKLSEFSPPLNCKHDPTGSYVVDVKNVYHPIRGTFLKKVSGDVSLYAIDESELLWLGDADCGVVKGADKGSFTALLYDYAKDKSHMYWRKKIIAGIDPDSFTALGYYGDFDGTWARDKNNLYYNGEKFASLATLEDLGGGWTRNENKVYLFRREHSEIDAKSFVNLGRYQKDQYHVYWGEHAMSDADAKTFNMIDAITARDNHAVYYGYNFPPTVVLPVDAASFHAVSNGMNMYYADLLHVYVGDEYTLTPLEGATPLSFNVLGKCGCVEKSCGYYTKDEQSVFCGSKKLQGADPATFSVIGSYGDNGEGMPFFETIAKDKNCVYQQELPLLSSNGTCVSPLMCTLNPIDQKNKTVCGYPISLGYERQERVGH